MLFKFIVMFMSFLKPWILIIYIHLAHIVVLAVEQNSYINFMSYVFGIHLNHFH